MTRWVLSGLLCAALAVFTVGGRSSGAANDQVSDEAAATVVGGQCYCWQNVPCGSGSPCTGGCWVPCGTCAGYGSNGVNLGTCGGGCSGGYALNVIGCTTTTTATVP